MVRRTKLVLLGSLFALVACGAGTAVAIHHGSSSEAKEVGGQPAAKAVAVTEPAIVTRTYEKRLDLLAEASRETPPGLGKARGWLNVTRTPTDDDLKGRVVVLDFWTSCCINCMQTLPTLARLEKKYATDPVLVMGVHTQKFDAEPEPERLRAAIIRLGIHHPVAIDGDRGIWEAWGVEGWPTIVILDVKGRVIWADSGEPDERILDAVIESALAEGQKEGALAKAPASFIGKEIDPSHPLAYPEKIAKVPGGYAIADSGHDRIVFVDEAGKLVEVVGDGTRGNVDGSFAGARFAHPQGIAAMGDVVYVADTENQEVRAIDRKQKTVSTVAGTGQLGFGTLDGEVDAKKYDLRSPWDLAVVGGKLYVALAGSHQIATLDPSKGKLAFFAGKGREDRRDGSLAKAAFAQPSGLATDGKDLFVLDSETSSVRRIDLAEGEVSTLVGKALFTWGDIDGDGKTARLQHPVGLTYGDGFLYVADTYNSKVKRVDPKSGETTTVGGGSTHFALFEPAGLVVVPNSKPLALLVADTDHDRVAKLTLGSDPAVTEWPIEGLKAAP